MEKINKFHHNNREQFNGLEKNRRDIHKSKIDVLNNKFQALAQAVETLKSTISFT